MAKPRERLDIEREMQALLASVEEGPFPHLLRLVEGAAGVGQALVCTEDDAEFGRSGEVFLRGISLLGDAINGSRARRFLDAPSKRTPRSMAEHFDSALGDAESRYNVLFALLYLLVARVSAERFRRQRTLGAALALAEACKMSPAFAVWVQGLDFDEVALIEGFESDLHLEHAAVEEAGFHVIDLAGPLRALNVRIQLTWLKVILGDEEAQRVCHESLQLALSFLTRQADHRWPIGTFSIIGPNDRLSSILDAILASHKDIQPAAEELRSIEGFPRYRSSSPHYEFQPMLLSSNLLRPRRYVVRPPDLQYLVQVIERTVIDAVRLEPVRFLRSRISEIGRSVQVEQFQRQLSVLTLLQTDREFHGLCSHLGSSATQLLGNLIAPSIALLLVKSLDLPSEATSFLTKTVDTFLTRLRKRPAPLSTLEPPVPSQRPRRALRSPNESTRTSRRRDR